MSFARASGILLHPTSLAGEFGIGDLGAHAFAFVDFLAETGQSYWQILPLGPTGYGDSPYQSFSAFAGNALMISPELLFKDDLVTEASLAGKPDFPSTAVDFGAVYEWKNQLLRDAYQEFHHLTSVDLRGKFETFCQENEGWLDEYALFRAIKAQQQQRSWIEWPDPLRLRDLKVLEQSRSELFEEIQAEKLNQFLFFRQWSAVKKYASRHGIKIIGDVPIFVALDSADVWCDQNKFKLGPDGAPLVVAGVPPDYFSKTGQFWGNPIYDWNAMQRDGFRWWVDRFKSTLKMVDLIRLDHFRGFAASWEIPGNDKTAENGRWVEAPGEELFATLKRNIGDLPIIAEDLGVITPDVEALRDGLELPGMRILQFAFGGDGTNLDLPHNYVRNCVAYTGTHDNDTAVGWFNSQVGAGSTRDETAISRERAYCLEYLHSDGSEIHWDFVRAVWASVAHIAIAPLQDLLGRGTEGRMNLPASASGNWQWRLTEGAITDEIKDRLRRLTQVYGRAE